MFSSANTPLFTLTLDGVAQDFQVLAFDGHEAIGQPYRFQLELVSERPDWPLEALLQRPAFLALGPGDQGIHGQLAAVAQGDTGRRLTRYRAELVPRLASLAHRVNSRIFQGLAVPEILAQLLEEHGILDGDYRFALGPTRYPPRDYCVQYGESDLAFLTRLCEEEGLHFHHQHRRDGHVLVFGDDATGFARLGATRYRPGSGLVADEPVISRLAVGLRIRSSASLLRDHDPLHPRLHLQSSTGTAAQPRLEDYGFPGRFTDRAVGQRLNTRRLERLRGDVHQAQGASDQPSLASGHFLPLEQHPRADWNQLWLLTDVRHQGRQPQVLEESLPQASAEDFYQGYRNTFVARPWTLPFRLPLRHPRPGLLGAQTAVVTGPTGEEIHCDALGRVKVQFHWDRQGQADERTSCWLRVASGWAGAGYGALSVPRIGMEVLVGFLEGDPDQPLVIGCLHHAEHRPPLELPRDRTRSTFKSLSSPGGNGYNELRLEDRQSQEEIHLHAQRDWDERIGHDHRSEIGHERHQRIGANSYSTFHAEEHRITHGERRTEVRADDHLDVSESQHLRLDGGLFVEAGSEIQLQSGQKIVLEAGAGLTLKAGGSFVQLDAGGVTLVGPSIRVNP
ncbi:type VI secretion system tip protein VgrG [Pseudomonas sp. MS15a(2019)]|uniref:type VI secretion system Vgr family protein n=1 Tax=Pseudomonas sp. MS15a(2019) TaxID=2579938 RepID=UPI0015656104|nr:type VI secretion system tip protein VgrG [Pseudomonas sp. MS15a(2019)]NRH42511.1 type VI secretion system tip protein VgrG [Pseudomonas sp. MS15a(2019)]